MRVTYTGVRKAYKRISNALERIRSVTPFTSRAWHHLFMSNVYSWPCNMYNVSETITTWSSLHLRLKLETPSHESSTNFEYTVCFVISLILMVFFKSHGTGSDSEPSFWGNRPNPTHQHCVNVLANQGLSGGNETDYHGRKVVPLQSRVSGLRACRLRPKRQHF